MCGITGKIFFDRERVVDHAEIKRMTDSMSHRGPDDDGILIDGNISLGFRRLSIIDLNTGHQPLANQDLTKHIIFNGEIYNYQEQRLNLQKKGYKFKTETDTEVILLLYEEYGPNCLEYIRGMFGFAIWDSVKRQLFCARDRFGIKPFYFYRDKEKFVFGSEIKSILSSTNLNIPISAEALDSYFSFGYITSDLSIFENINKLQPGCYLLLTPDKGEDMQIEKYWEIKFEPDYSISEDRWIEEIQESLDQTVRQHMISDVPLGAFLSGGIDSSSVVASMARNSDRPVKTFSIGFKEQRFSELEYAREVASKYNCEHHEQIIEPESIELLPDLVRAYDEPFADKSAIPTYYVSKFARQHVTVALSGDGGDELFAGYDTYTYFKKLRRFSSPFPGVNRLIWGNIHKMIPHKVAGKGLSYFLSQEKEFIGASLCLWNKYERRQLFLNGLDGPGMTKASEPYKKSILTKGSGLDFISKLQYLDMQTFMVDDVLTKVDRASMMSSLEVRVPLLDHKFAEMCFRIPAKLKLKGKEQKYIFKEAMSPYLSKNILGHQKQGFSLPISVWFKEDLKSYVNDTLLSTNANLSEYLDKKYISRIIKDNQAGMRDFSTRIWSLLIFEEWLKQTKQK